MSSCSSPATNVKVRNDADASTTISISNTSGSTSVVVSPKVADSLNVSLSKIN